MSRIRWEEDFGAYPDEHEWLGYLGQIIICKVNYMFELEFRPTYELEEYSSLRSAKRGAERMLGKFLRDAGLQVKEVKDAENQH